MNLKSVIKTLVEAVRAKNGQNAIEWSKTSEWSTIEHFLVDGSKINIKINEFFLNFIFCKASASMVEEWQCQMCTFLNEDSATVCQMCQTSRS